MKIQVKKNEGIQLVPITDILYMEADAPYTYIYMSSEEKLFSTDSIGYFDHKLESEGFLRIHKSLLVNVRCIKHYQKEGNGTLFLEGGHKLNMARGKKQKLLRCFEEYFL